MGFSFPSLFQSSGEAPETGMPPPGTSPATPGSGSQDSRTQSTQPLNIAVPTMPFGTPLFRTAPGESLEPQSMAASPFSVPASSHTGCPLTVADVLPQLPPELARFGALTPDQPVAVSPQVLDAALRSGNAALPIFEVYRVCPALFLTPISPQDTRMVSLPASKLPRLIAATQQTGGAEAPELSKQPPMQNRSPFSAFTDGSGSLPPSPSSPPGLTVLPPKRVGPPPPLAEVPVSDVSLELPGGSGAKPPAEAPAFPTSPFIASKPGLNSDKQIVSPFGTLPANPMPAQPGMFPGNSEVANSPFSAMASPSQPSAAFGAPASPATPSQDRHPALTTSAAAPFMTQPQQGFSLPGAQPASQPQPQANLQVQHQPPVGAFGQPAPVAGATDAGKVVRISLANLLKGHGAGDLGFEPSIVPAWIMTSLPAANIREQLSQGAVTLSLGTVIEGVSDVGFRNVLKSAKHDFQLRLPASDLQAALAGGEPQTLPNLSSLGLTQAKPAASPMQNRPTGAEPTSPPVPFTALTPGPATPFPQFGGAPFRAEQAPAAAAVPASSGGLSQPQGTSKIAVDPFAPAGEVVTPAAFSTSPGLTSQGEPAAANAPPVPSANAASSLQSMPRPSEGIPSHPAPGATKLPADGLSSADLLGATAPPAGSGGVAGRGPGDENRSQDDTTPVTTERSAEDVKEPDPRPQDMTLPAAPPLAFPEAPPAASQAQPPTRSRPSQSPSTRNASSFLGLQPMQANSDQMLLRALLSTEEELTPQRVVELTSQLPGIAACVCLSGDRSFSHAGAHKPQAREFQRQAVDLAHHLRALAPLIGIEGAETFTMNAGDRLMTFCFPEDTTLGVLHDAEPSVGLRDKITLIARELSRMLS